MDLWKKRGQAKKNRTASRKQKVNPRKSQKVCTILCGVPEGVASGIIDTGPVKMKTQQRDMKRKMEAIPLYQETDSTVRLKYTPGQRRGGLHLSSQHFGRLRQADHKVRGQRLSWPTW